MLAWIFRNAKMITAGTIILTVISIWGITRISLNNYLIEGLTRHDDLRKDFDFFEQNYSGVRPFELVIKTTQKDHTLLGVEELRAMDKLENFLEKKYGVGFMISPLTMIKAVNEAQHDGNPDYFALPKDSSDIADLVDALGNNKKRKEARLYLSEGDTVGRVSGKMHDVGSKLIRSKNAE